MVVRNFSRPVVLVFAVISGLSISCAWWEPGTTLCAALGWVAALSLVLTTDRERSLYFPAYVTGVIAMTLGFYWLCTTIKDFGGFGNVPAALIFSLFVVASAVQYLVFIFIVRNLPEKIHRFALGVPTALVLSEFISIRIFPWQYGHTQLGFVPFAQIADIGGVYLISFLMFWICEALRNSILYRDGTRALFASLLGGLFALIYGQLKIGEYSALPSHAQHVSLVQANIAIEEKHDVKYFAKNTERYVNLSKPLAKDGTLIIWPESVIVDWVSSELHNVNGDPRLPNFTPNASLLTGALTFDDPKHYYNSGLAIYSDGRIPKPYNKQILMPFGEYTPFSSSLPWLEEMHMTPDFTPGKEVRVFEFPRAGDAEGKDPVKASPLICYEDVIPSISRDAARKGAELLVNLTNDAWFGDSVAPYEHHLIASFRAIENRRFLLRSTNSGLTAIVNPLGQTTSQLKPFSEGVLSETVGLWNKQTLYSRYIGEIPWWVLLGFASCIIIARKVIK